MCSTSALISQRFPWLRFPVASSKYLRSRPTKHKETFSSVSHPNIRRSACVIDLVQLWLSTEKINVNHFTDVATNASHAWARNRPRPVVFDLFLLLTDRRRHTVSQSRVKLICHRQVPSCDNGTYPRLENAGT